MKSDSESRRDEPSESETRFDEESAQRILRRAAEEQTRWESEEVDSYTLEQLQAIASEAGISPEAVRAAAMELEASSGQTTSELRVTEDEGGGGWLAALKRRMPASWSPRLKHLVLIAVGVALSGVFISLVGVVPVVLALSVAIVLLILFLLVGLGPF